MGPRQLRSRLLDLAVATACLACVCAPVVPLVLAAGQSAPVNESGGHVDQRVVQSGIISIPLNGSFGSGRDGVVDGSVQWDLSTSAGKGMKLVISSDRSPAMRDAQNAVDVPDQGATPGDWVVPAGERRFGFTTAGPLTLGRFGDGQKWRGFDGPRSIELGRKVDAPIGRTRTTVKLRAGFGAALASDARPTANVRATGVLNL